MQSIFNPLNKGKEQLEGRGGKQPELIKLKEGKMYIDSYVYDVMEN